MMDDQCPKCGGDSGYFTASINRHEQHFTWGGEPDNCEVELMRGGRIKRCLDCNANVTALVTDLEGSGDE